MSKKHFSWLLAVTLIAALVILFMPGRTSHKSAFEVHPLVPGLDARINEVSRVRIVAAGDRTVATLLRHEGGWLVEEAGLYPADWVRLKTLMAALAQAEVIEPKTANPEYFERLGLTDVAGESSTAVKVELGAGENLVSVLVGSAAREREGQYVRLNDENQALLINRSLDVPSDSSAWLERKIIDIADSEVVEVNITHPDGEAIALVKPSADLQDFTLQNIPKDREIASAWSVNSLGDGLSGLELEEVRADTGVDWSQAIHVRVLTADGVEVKAEVVDAEEKHWLRLSAAAYPGADPLDALADALESSMQNAKEGKAEADNEADPEGDAAEDAAENSAKVAESTAAEERGKRVDDINRRVRGWAYAIPGYKAELMSKHLEDLLKPVEKA